ncbi:hypothetical protein [Leptospira barantonii]|uniref:SH3 domain-containing protein n=1 Tax=Leptospira barantonii TaxID=2023184 RepID=A0ABX4NPY9_9LEPT|nr:hypothetical protein [Leptospira barantonii]PJZ58909.1 hypothetical protein CH367_02415 [Leptospira barantonii]
MKFIYTILAICILLIGYIVIFENDIPELEMKKKIGIINTEKGIKLYLKPNFDSNSTDVKVRYGTVVNILETIPPKLNQGVWTKIELPEHIGWMFVVNLNLLESSTEENELFVSNIDGVDVFEAQSTTSKRIKKLDYGERVKLLTFGFQNPEDAKIYNLIKVGTKLGFVLDDEFTSRSYSKEEIKKAPFVGMEYRGMIHNCDSHYASAVAYKREEWSEDYYISRESCGKKEFVILSKSVKHIGQGAIFIIQNIMDVSQYETDKDKQLVVEQDLNEMLHCMSQDFVNTVTWVDLKKGKETVETDKSRTYENVILKTWVIDQKTENLVEIDTKDQKCYYPAPWY